MKVLLIVAAIVVAVQALTDEQQAKLVQYHSDCIAESGADPEVVAKAKNGEFTGDAKFKDYLFCMSKKIGSQNDKGEFQFDVIKAKVNSVTNDQAKTDALVQKCAVQKATPQETAYDTVKCYFDTDKVNVL